MAAAAGVEPATCSLGESRSIQLSYATACFVVLRMKTSRIRAADPEAPFERLSLTRRILTKLGKPGRARPKTDSPDATHLDQAQCTKPGTSEKRFPDVRQLPCKPEPEAFLKQRAPESRSVHAVGRTPIPAHRIRHVNRILQNADHVLL